MKRVFILISLSAWLGACAGNPPTWWNPGNRYGTAQDSTKTKTATKTVKPKTTVIKEEKIDLVDESYEEEEIVLTPMPDEDNEEGTGVAASQNEELLPVQDRAAAQAEQTTAKKSTAQKPTENPLPTKTKQAAVKASAASAADDTLPMPSVLE